MKNWKDFDWTDNCGEPLPPQFQWAAVDKSGQCYAYNAMPLIIDTYFACKRVNSTIQCKNFKVENWQESLINRKDYKESDKSAFTEENFKKWIDDIDGRHPFGYESEAKGVFDAFKSYLESLKPLSQEVTDAMAILEKHGYKFTKG